MSRILIIDDDPQIRSIYRRFLIDEGYDVTEAKDAQDGTFKMIQKSDELDLVLLDINMPEVDGEFMKQVLDEWNPRLKVLVSSVYPLEEQRRLVPNASDYFDKSMGTLVLLNKIHNLLESP